MDGVVEDRVVGGWSGGGWSGGWMEWWVDGVVGGWNGGWSGVWIGLVLSLPSHRCKPIWRNYFFKCVYIAGLVHRYNF